ncbi:thymocyte nuclear protein 1-like [Pecten maximus]|uniref:thymocyte nuclear protein 1-like n=1 Tax=Pecten maximus TaxID=6579 RepID=UPI001458441D|nr:thymocyte nuclear protein 1-like [Pecten maximus]
MRGSEPRVLKKIVNIGKRHLSSSVNMPGKVRGVKRKRDTEVKPTKEKASNNTTQTKTEQKATSSYTHWLMKSEPESRIEKGVDVKFGIEDLKACENQTACWDGVRNYQARNFMRDGMKLGQKMFFYHSNTKVPGIAGICEIVKESYPDHTQFDSKDIHYDASAKKDSPRWFMVDVKFERMLKRFIPLAELKQLYLKHKDCGGPLSKLALFTRARLSVQPLTTEEWDFILSLEDEDSDS